MRIELSVLLLALSVCVHAQIVTQEDWTFYCNGQSAAVLTYNGSDSEVFIPDYVTTSQGQFAVTKVGDDLSHPFQGNTLLSSVKFPETVTSIDVEAFDGCSFLKQVSLSRNLVEIASYAFYRCASLDTIALPRPLSYIGMMAFGGCKAMRSIRLREEVTTLQGYTFEGTPLTTLYVDAPRPPVCAYDLVKTGKDDFYGQCTLVVPIGCGEAYRNAPVWERFSHVIEVPLRGDINADGSCDVTDVNILVNRLLRKDENDYGQRDDINADHVIDVSDINELINILLGRE
ncbi:MAG: leucine-rich repeat protein [Muribaculaceae bacterium]|nr:leucine-rich repeat protein [Muribaculaceae bacterium]